MAKPVKVNDLEKYTIMKVHRSQVKGAPYNPRVISAKAKAKLRTNIEKVGMLEPIIWNMKTGHIVSGHQRLAVMDAIHGTKNYELTVAAVELDPKAEVEQNIFMNNPEAQGGYDMDELEKLLAEAEPVNAGFDTSDMLDWFGKADKRDIEADTAEMSEAIQAMENAFQAVRQKSFDRDRDDFYVMLVFETAEEAHGFLESVDIHQYRRYISGRDIAARIKSKPKGGE